MGLLGWCLGYWFYCRVGCFVGLCFCWLCSWVVCVVDWSVNCCFLVLLVGWDVCVVWYLVFSVCWCFWFSGVGLLGWFCWCWNVGVMLGCLVGWGFCLWWNGCWVVLVDVLGWLVVVCDCVVFGWLGYREWSVGCCVVFGWILFRCVVCRCWCWGLWWLCCVVLGLDWCWSGWVIGCGGFLFCVVCCGLYGSGLRCCFVVLLVVSVCGFLLMGVVWGYCFVIGWVVCVGFFCWIGWCVCCWFCWIGFDSCLGCCSCWVGWCSCGFVCFRLLVMVGYVGVGGFCWGWWGCWCGVVGGGICGVIGFCWWWCWFSGGDRGCVCRVVFGWIWLGWLVFRGFVLVSRKFWILLFVVVMCVVLCWWSVVFRWSVGVCWSGCGLGYWYWCWWVVCVIIWFVSVCWYWVGVFVCLLCVIGCGFGFSCWVSCCDRFGIGWIGWLGVWLVDDVCVGWYCWWGNVVGCGIWDVLVIWEVDVLGVRLVVFCLVWKFWECFCGLVLCDRFVRGIVLVIVFLVLWWCCYCCCCFCGDFWLMLVLIIGWCCCCVLGFVCFLVVLVDSGVFRKWWGCVGCLGDCCGWLWIWVWGWWFLRVLVLVWLFLV